MTAETTMRAERTAAPHCALEGCNAWARRGKPYCLRHQDQYEQNVALGLEDPTPRLTGPVTRTCRARGCLRAVAVGSEYCPRHTAEVREGSLVVAEAQGTAAAIAEGFATLLAHLDSQPPDCLAVLQREVEMLGAARKVLVAHARVSGRKGWKLMSPVAFMRLWIASTEAVTTLTKARFVMETATSADFDRLLAGVYGRIEREGAVTQRPLPGQPELPGLTAPTVDGVCTVAEEED